VFKASRGIEDIYELTYIRKDGRRFPAVVSVTALRDAHNTIIGYLLIGTDNTARKQVEVEQRKLDQRLRDQQFYTRSLIESNIDALMTTDQSGIISDVNKQMEALTGCTLDELIGAPFKNYFTDAEQAQAGIKRALQETNVALEGARFAAHKSNLAKSDFLSSMSQELRSPLNAILGFAHLMESGVPLPTPSQKDSIAQILQAGWYLLELINEILDLSLIGPGKLSLSLESLSMIEVLADRQAMIEPQA